MKPPSWTAPPISSSSARYSDDSAYGGSKNHISCLPSASRVPAMALRLTAVILHTAPALRSLAMFRSISFTCSALASSSVTPAAPRLAASSPIAPEPAKISAKSLPSTLPRLLNNASRARPEVGRIERSDGVSSIMPRARPEMIFRAIIEKSAIKCKKFASFII